MSQSEQALKIRFIRFAIPLEIPGLPSIQRTYMPFVAGQSQSGHQWRGWSAKLTANAVELRSTPSPNDGKSLLVIVPRIHCLIVCDEQSEVQRKPAKAEEPKAEGKAA